MTVECHTARVGHRGENLKKLNSYGHKVGLFRGFMWHRLSAGVLPMLEAETLYPWA
jgi:hypothetical protein